MRNRYPKTGDWVKIKKFRPGINDDIFWEKCGGKSFKVIHADNYNRIYKLDFRDVYKPVLFGFIDISAIEYIHNNNIYLQDELFQL